MIILIIFFSLGFLFIGIMELTHKQFGLNDLTSQQILKRKVKYETKKGKYSIDGKNIQNFS